MSDNTSADSDRRAARDDGHSPSTWWFSSVAQAATPTRQFHQRGRGRSERCARARRAPGTVRPALTRTTRHRAQGDAEADGRRCGCRRRSGSGVRQDRARHAGDRVLGPGPAGRSGVHVRDRRARARDGHRRRARQGRSGARRQDAWRARSALRPPRPARMRSHAGTLLPRAPLKGRMKQLGAMLLAIVSAGHRAAGGTACCGSRHSAGAAHRRRSVPLRLPDAVPQRTTPTASSDC